jgi:transcriptional regulator with XRE-family HTH domain
MKKHKKTMNAVEILHRRYVGDDPERKASLQEERVNAEVARAIYDLRVEAGLSQKELAARIGTTQSVISRLEDADYDGHSLKMLHRIATALRRRLTVVMALNDDKTRRSVRVIRHTGRRAAKMPGEGRTPFAAKAHARH